MERFTYWKEGTPTNESAWNLFKGMTTSYQIVDGIEITEDMISEIWSPIRDAYSTQIVSSSMELFKSHCKENNLEWVYKDQCRSNIICIRHISNRY